MSSAPTQNQRRVFAVLSLLVLLTATACSKSGKETDKGAPTGAANASCTGVLRSDPSASLPAGFPALPGQTLYDPNTQGATKVVFGRLSGGPGDLIRVRDKLASLLTSAGYTINGKDQEPGAEADLDFGSPHDGTANVRPLCKDHIVVRYRFTG